MTIQAMRGLLLAAGIIIYAGAVQAAQYAAIVMDARTGKVIHSQNADTRVHPASLTKMMTLYLVFDAIKKGQLSADQMVTISRHAASKPPSKLGLKPGQRIEVKYLIRAAAVKSANDAAAALAEAVAGSEDAFARRMTAAARAMGMKNTTFKNASGLTQSGHLSSARDMAILGRQLFFDFPEYYNLFSRRSTSAGVKTVYNTNRRLLDSYPGADGIKTGYTQAAGFNLVSSAQRGQERVIVAVLGGTSTAARDRKVAELMDLGFSKMPSRTKIARPARPNLSAPEPVQVAAAPAAPAATTSRQLAAGPIRKAQVRPVLRPASDATVIEIARALTDTPAPEPIPDVPAVVAEADRALATSIRPVLRPAEPGRRIKAGTETARETLAGGAKVVRVSAPAQETGWAVQLGGTHNRTNAERLLLRTALEEMETLDGSKRDLKPAGSPGWYHARFVGLSRQAAQTACARLAARQTPCEVVAVGG